MSQLVIKSLSIINFFYPKKRNQVLFISSPDLTDNGFAFFIYLIKNRNKYNFVWLVDDVEKTESYKKMISSYIGLEQKNNVRIYHKKSLIGMLAYMRSKYIFFTHGFYAGIAVSKNQIRVNLWHGMPLKAIGYLNKYGNNSTIPKATYALATSERFQDIISKAFTIEKKRVLLAGQPRCDLLFKDKQVLKKLGVNKEEYNKIIFWAPTYRHTKCSRIEDGNFKGSLPILDNNGSIVLNRFLKSNNAYMVIKLHPMDILNEYAFEELSHLTILKDSAFLEGGYQLYSLMAEVDILVTDYSSIYIDFLLLDRPIVFAIDDFEAYRKTRDFVFDNPLEYMPGPIVNNLDSLVKELTLLIDEGKDTYRGKRTKIKQIFHKYDNSFSKRLARYLSL